MMMVVFPGHTYDLVSAVWVFQLALPFFVSDFMLFTCEYITERSGKKSFSLAYIFNIIFNCF